MKVVCSGVVGDAEDMTMTIMTLFLYPLDERLFVVQREDLIIAFI